MTKNKPAVGALSVCRVKFCEHPLLRNGRHVNKDKADDGTAHCINALLEENVDDEQLPR